MTHEATVVPTAVSMDREKETCEINWTITYWGGKRKHEAATKCQHVVFETGAPGAWFKTKWYVGLKLVPGGNSGRKARVCWKLLEIHGSDVAKVEAEMQTQLYNYRTNSFQYTDKKIREVKEFDIVEGTSECLQFNPDSDAADEEFMNPIGTVRFKLLLTLKRPTLSPAEYDRHKLEQFWKTSVERLQRDQAALLNDHSESADLKLVTSDDVEIRAHKMILKARCPVFAAMLNCDLSESATGIIRMTDISGKTMRILLHYFYTGELLPSWSDRDTIMEFVYAAGKYQLTEVLQMLDDMHGRNLVGDASSLDIQVMNLLAKLKLVKAEARMLRRIVTHIKMLTTGDELFKLFGFEEEEISEMAEKLAIEQVGQSRILKLLNCLYDGKDIDSKDLYAQGMSLLAFVQQQKMEKVETNLLRRFGVVAAWVGNTNQLLNLFGCGKQMEI